MTLNAVFLEAPALPGRGSCFYLETSGRWSSGSASSFSSKRRNVRVFISCEIPPMKCCMLAKRKICESASGVYRVANPDRLGRRHLRLLRSVKRIELQECDSEASALAKEASLLRNLRPRFNRSGTWPSSPQYLTWRLSKNR